jgi:hypothetical protein
MAVENDTLSAAEEQIRTARRLAPGEHEQMTWEALSAYHRRVLDLIARHAGVDIDGRANWLAVADILVALGADRDDAERAAASIP